MKAGQAKKGTRAYQHLEWRGELPQKPWTERLRLLLQRVSEGNVRHNDCTRKKRRSQWKVDQKRAISEGYCRVTPRTSYTIKYLVLTDAGRALIATPPQAALPQPYAKSLAGMAEFNEVNGIGRGRARADQA